MTKPVDRLALHAPALETREVESREVRAVAHDRARRDHVPLHPAHAADHRVVADAHELVHRAQPAEHGEVAHLHMARQRGVVGRDDVRADPAVVRDMAAHHEQAAVADAGQPPAALSAGVHGDVLADLAVGADGQPRALARELQVLRLRAEGCEGEDARARPDLGLARDADMGIERHALAQRGLRAHHAEGADADARGQPRPLLHDGRGMDDGAVGDGHSGGSTIMAENSLSATSLPSTLATPRKRQTRPFDRWTVTCSSSVAPGSTGARKRVLSTVMK